MWIVAVNIYVGLNLIHERNVTARELQLGTFGVTETAPCTTPSTSLTHFTHLSQSNLTTDLCDLIVHTKTENIFTVVMQRFSGGVSLLIDAAYQQLWLQKNSLHHLITYKKVTHNPCVALIGLMCLWAESSSLFFFVFWWLSHLKPWEWSLVFSLHTHAVGPDRSCDYWIWVPP